MQHVYTIMETWHAYITQSLMVIHDDDHDQGFTNLDERDMINTTHAYFEKNKHVNKV